MVTLHDLTPAISKRQRQALDRKAELSPKQALAATLYDIDHGEFEPGALIVVYAVRNESGAYEVGYQLATGAEQADAIFLAGMLQKAGMELLGGGE